jgi:hypothetical protein
MAVVISEILTEVVLTSQEGPDGGAGAGSAGGASAAGGGLGEDAMDVVVRRATERVLEVLRREWDR